MPYVTIDLMVGRSDEKKLKLAAALTAAFTDVIGSRPEDVTIIYNDIAENDWYIAGEQAPKPVTQPPKAD